MYQNLQEGIDRELRKINTVISQIGIQEIKTKIKEERMVAGVREDQEIKMEMAGGVLEEEEEAIKEIAEVVQIIEDEVVGEEEAGEEVARDCFNVHPAFIKDHLVRFQCLHWITYFSIIKLFPFFHKFVCLVDL